MILEFDAGNTRIKWRLLEPNAQGDEHKLAEGAVLALEKAPSVFLELGQQLERLPLAAIRRTRVADVRGPVFREALAALLSERWHLPAQFAQPQRQLWGLTTAYAEPALLGTDRWLAMLAAWQAVKRACCVIDLGSAVTVDLVDGRGQHEGGYILPGLSTMRDALAARSQALRIDGQARWGDLTPGRDTQSAVEHGILRLVLALLRDLRRDEPSPGRAWFLTGGDAGVLAPLLDWPHSVEPDLVLNGLVYALD